MELFLIVILAIVLLGAVSILLLRQNLILKKRVSRLEKEVEIQDSRLNYQKEQYSDSANYFYSAVVIIMQMLQELNSALKSEEKDLSGKILQIIFENAKNLFKPRSGGLFRVDVEKNAFSCFCAFGYKDEELQALGSSLNADSSFLGWSAATGRFLSFQEANQDSILSHLITSDPLRCHYAQPLKVNNKVTAVLCIGALLQQVEEDVVVQLFSILSNIASVTLSDAILTQELRELSIRDSLTGLYNHSYFQKWLELALGSLREKDDVISLVMGDLDYFKRINDTHGHQAGDVVLKNICNLLNNLPTSDYICARYGGDEFAMIFKGKDANQTFSIIEDALQKVSQKVFEIDNESACITVSAGIAEARFSETEKINKADLIASADQALYRAKTEGRNRVIIAG